jgi:hypothetical protein
MDLPDETDYAKQDRQDLVARLMSAQAAVQFLLRAYHAFRSYGVDFMKLPEWNMEALRDAHKLKPHQAQPRVIAFWTRLENALSAAIRRKQFKLHNLGGNDPPKQP